MDLSACHQAGFCDAAPRGVYNTAQVHRGAATPEKPAGDFVLDGGKSEGVLLSKVAHQNSSHTMTQV